MLPYVAIILVTLLLAAVVTRGVDAWLRDADVSGTTRTVAVAAAFLGVYVIMFVVRYLLLDRLFRPARGPRMSDAFTQATGRGLEDDAGANQRRYQAYQLELMRPHFGASLLEVGAGLGEFAAQLTGLERHVVTDVDPGGGGVDGGPVRGPARSRGAGARPRRTWTSRSASRWRRCWRSTCSSTSRTTPRRCAGWPR